jgi:hypothetical protein
MDGGMQLIEYRLTGYCDDKEVHVVAVMQMYSTQAEGIALNDTKKETKQVRVCPWPVGLGAFVNGAK